jgi:hypothetical protein
MTDTAAQPPSSEARRSNWGGLRHPKGGRPRKDSAKNQADRPENQVANRPGNQEIKSRSPGEALPAIASVIPCLWCRDAPDAALAEIALTYRAALANLPLPTRTCFGILPAACCRREPGPAVVDVKALVA